MLNTASLYCQPTSCQPGYQHLCVGPQKPTEISDYMKPAHSTEAFPHWFDTQLKVFLSKLTSSDNQIAGSPNNLTQLLWLISFKEDTK